MPLRQLTLEERQRLGRLTAESIDFALIQPTKTGLKKSILDATEPIRRFLKSNELHDYGTQGQGASIHKVKLRALLLCEDDVVESHASLYRPKTKKGEPADLVF